MSNEVEPYRYYEIRDERGEALYKGYTNPTYPVVETDDVRASSIEFKSKPSSLTEGQVRAIASEVGRENKVNYNGLVFLVIAGVVFVVVVAMILVACQHQPVIITPPSNKPNCHFMCGG